MYIYFRHENKIDQLASLHQHLASFYFIASLSISFSFPPFLWLFPTSLVFLTHLSFALLPLLLFLILNLLLLLTLLFFLSSSSFFSPEMAARQRSIIPNSGSRAKYDPIPEKCISVDRSLIWSQEWKILSSWNEPRPARFLLQRTENVDWYKPLGLSMHPQVSYTLVPSTEQNDERDT